jgi:hypothetical protein
MQIFHDGVPKFRQAPVAIEIFDPKNNLSAVLFSALPGPPEGDRVSEMKVTRRRWGNATAIGNFRFQFAELSLA